MIAQDPMLALLGTAGTDWRHGWAAGSAVLRAGAARRRLVLAGMGGSAIAGDLVGACIGAYAPVTVVRGYTIPPHLLEDAFFVASSFSGATEETLAAVESSPRPPDAVIASGGELADHARAAGWPLIQLPGGRPPRAALYVTWAALLALATRVGLARITADDAENAARAAGETACQNASGAPAEGHPARGLAEHLAGGLPLLVATTPALAAVATRWKGELHENAKVVCITTELPEMNHNEIVGATARSSAAPLRAVLLRDPEGEHPRVGVRAHLTRSLLEEAGVPVREAVGHGDTHVARLVSLALLGDHMSVYAALLRGVDSTPTPILDRIKNTLRSASP